MKLTLRLRPLSSFLGVLDLKSGVVVALLFALLNKVAGIYGLIASLTGASSSFAQLSLYIYSLLALLVLSWGLSAVSREDPLKTLYFAHLYALDHVVSTSWVVYFAVVWFVKTAHDGHREAKSAAQQEIIDKTPVWNQTYTEEERALAAQAIWRKEKGFALAIIIVCWLSKIYLGLLIYSYATHLRKGSYKSLPMNPPSTINPSSSNSTSFPSSSSNTHNNNQRNLEEGSGALDSDFYRTPFGGSANANGRLSSRAPSTTSGGEEETLFDEEMDLGGVDSGRKR